MWSVAPRWAHKHSPVVLFGLLANALFGASWLDPAVGVMIAAVALKEGRDAWRGDGCCT